MKYRLTIYPAFEAGNPSIAFKFDTREEMESASSTTADMLIFMQDKAKVMEDYSNMFIKEYCSDNGEWEEIDSL